jgi:hypothetical protein
VTDPQSPAELAEQAAEAIRALNRTTFSPDPTPPGYVQPSDVAATVGALETLAQRLPQAFRQASQWLSDGDDDGRIGDDRHGDPQLVVMEARHHLRIAEDLAISLAATLTKAHNLTARMTGTEGDLA